MVTFFEYWLEPASALQAATAPANGSGGSAERVPPSGSAGTAETAPKASSTGK